MEVSQNRGNDLAAVLVTLLTSTMGIAMSSISLIDDKDRSGSGEPNLFFNSSIFSGHL